MGSLFPESQNSAAHCRRVPAFWLVFY